MWSEYAALLRRVRQLRRELLPPVSPTASYSDREVFQMRGFRLLAHAELEGFLESCAETMNSHYADLLSQGRLSARMRRYLLVHKEMVDKYPPRCLTPQLLGDKAENGKIKGILNGHQSMINGNNGVSEKDVLKLFVPLGCELSAFDHAWLDSLNDLARARGEVAHNSFLVVTPTFQPTPTEECRLLVLPLFGLRLLIEELLRLYSAAYA